LRTPLETGLTCEQQADACAALLESMGIASAAVIGVSGGGPAALQFARKYRAKCTGLILLSAVTKRMPTPERLNSAIVQFGDLAGWLLSGAVHRHPARYTKRLLLPAEAEMLQDPAKRASFLRFLDTSVPFSFRYPGLKNDALQIRSISDQVPADVGCPTLIAHGTADGIVPFDHATSAAAAIPGARLVTIEGGGHFAALFDAPVVRKAISELLAATETRRAAG